MGNLFHKQCPEVSDPQSCCLICHQDQPFATSWCDACPSAAQRQSCATVPPGGPPTPPTPAPAPVPKITECVTPDDYFAQGGVGCCAEGLSYQSTDIQPCKDMECCIGFQKNDAQQCVPISIIPDSSQDPSYYTVFSSDEASNSNGLNCGTPSPGSTHACVTNEDCAKGYICSPYMSYGVGQTQSWIPICAKYDETPQCCCAANCGQTKTSWSQCKNILQGQDQKVEGLSSLTNYNSCKRWCEINFDTNENCSPPRDM